VEVTHTEDSRTHGHSALDDADLPGAPLAVHATASPSHSNDAGPVDPDSAPGQCLAGQPWGVDAPRPHEAALPAICLERLGLSDIADSIVLARPAEDCLASARTPAPLEDCVVEFTRRLQACVALPEDDERFQARVQADIEALKARCAPGDAFRFELKAARVLAEFGFTAWPVSTVPADAAHPLHDMAPVVDPPAGSGEAGPRAGVRAA
jgi:hypothetical protein